MAGFEAREADWLGLAEAVDRLLEVARPLGVEAVPLQDALHRAVAGDMSAPATLPPWDNSAMDGYAARAEDVRGASPDAPRVLRVVGETRAGSPPAHRLRPGEAVKIMTGAPVPPGADSVVRVEHTDAEAGEEGRVRIVDDRDAGGNVRPGGQDMEAGEVVVRAGAAVTPGLVAVLAALGRAEVPVHRVPRVGVLSSGDELRGPDRFEDVVAGRGIPETNGPALAAAVRAAGCEPVYLGVARDEPGDIRERIRRGAGSCDVLLTSGGASMGEADLFKRVLEEEGLRVDFWRVRIRPGSPFSLAWLPREGGSEGSELPVLGLPGNPASSYVTFQVLARPFLLRMAGHRRVHRRAVRARAGELLRSKARLTHFHRVTLHPDPGGGAAPEARLTGHQSSGLVRSLGLAHGLAVVPEGVEAVEAGEPVEVVLLDDAPGATEDGGYAAST